MKRKRIGLEYNGKRIEIDAKKVSEFEKGIGLMFSRREKANILLFEFKKPTKLKIHSLFVFFPFLAIWIDSKNKVIEKKIVSPFKISIAPEAYFSKLIEIPINKKNMEILKNIVEQKI